MEGNLKLAKKLNILAWVFTFIVWALVGAMRQYKFDVPIDTSFFPAISASLNTIVALCLLLALYFIKNKNVRAHKNAIYAAMVCSALFFLTYVGYHFTTEETKFCKTGTIRSIYFFVLLSHIVLAGLSFPFILFTFIRGFTGQVTRHRKMAKWVFPVWFYVAITGPIVYLMLRPCYN